MGTNNGNKMIALLQIMNSAVAKTFLWWKNKDKTSRKWWKIKNPEIT
jgi:hypothetical protein